MFELGICYEFVWHSVVCWGMFLLVISRMNDRDLAAVLSRLVWKFVSAVDGQMWDIGRLFSLFFKHLPGCKFDDQIDVRCMQVVGVGTNLFQQEVPRKTWQDGLHFSRSQIVMFFARLDQLGTASSLMATEVKQPWRVRSVAYFDGNFLFNCCLACDPAFFVIKSHLGWNLLHRTDSYQPKMVLNAQRVPSSAWARFHFIQYFFAFLAAP